MKRLCGAGDLARVLASAMKPQDRHDRLAGHRRRTLFAGRNARTTQFLLLALILAPAFAHAYAGPGAGFAVLSSFWAIFVAFHTRSTP